MGNIETKLDDLRINEYQLQGGSWPQVADVVLQRRPQRKGPDLWAIVEHGAVLDKDGDWIFELQPSSRTEQYLANCRFDSAEEAFAFWTEGGFQSRFSHYDEDEVS